MKTEQPVLDRRAVLGGAAALAIAASVRRVGGRVPTATRKLVERGVNYDVGSNFANVLSRASWRPEYVKAEMAAIADELGCTSVLIVGSDVGRLLEAATIAAEHDLGVWIEPRPFDVTSGAAIDLFATIATAAEALRADHERVVLSLGVEHTLFLSGLLPGDSWDERAASLETTDPTVVSERLNAFLGDARDAVGKVFRGPVTYSSGAWEDVDWRPFDLVGVDLYRDRYNAATFADQVRSYRRHGKPVVITEFGCCSYVGADDLGGLGFSIIDLATGTLRGNPVRDETVQADYLAELLDVFEAERVHGAFVWNFIEPDSPYSPDPAHDLDMACFAVVRCDGAGSPDEYATTGRWRPKEAYNMLADRWRR